MFENLMPGQVAFATDLLSYRPTTETGQSKIVVGTPTAIETALSKVRGKVGAERTKGHDYMQLQGQSVRPSVSPSVRLLVRLLVRPSVRP